MLSFFRRGGTGQVVIGAVVFAIIIVFVLEFRAGRSDGGSSFTEQCAVKVKGSCVDQKEFFAALGLSAYGMEPSQIRRVGMRKKTLDGLVERELLLSEADRLGISVSENEIDQELAAGRVLFSLPAAFVGPQKTIRLFDVKNTQSQQFDYKKYERAIRNATNRSPREFKEMQRREMVAQRMRELVQARVRVSEGEAWSAWKRENDKARIRSVLINRDWFGRFVVDQSDARVDAWALANKDQVDAAWKTDSANYKANCPLVREVTVNFSFGASDEDKTLLRDKIEQAEKRLKAKEPFAVVARELSDADSSLTGGELGCLTENYGLGGKELLAAAEKLKPGEISPVVESPRGFHLVQLVKRVPEAEIEKTGRRIVARNMAVKFWGDEMVTEFATKLLDKVKAGEKLDAASDELAKEYAHKGAGKLKPGGEPYALEAPGHPKVEFSAAFSVLDDPVPTALGSEALTVKALELTKPDELYPKPLQTENGLVVMQLKEKLPATKQEFDKAKADAMRAILAKKQIDALTRYVAALRKGAKDQIQVDERFADEKKDDQTPEG